MSIKRTKIQHLSRPAKAALILTVATFLCKGINIITTPIFTRLLSTSEMGIVTTYNSWYSLIYPIATLSLDSGSFNIAMMEYEDNRYKYISSILFMSSLSSIIVGMLYYCFRYFWDSLIGLNLSLMIMMFVSFIFNPATTFWMLHQRYEYKYKSTAIITVLSTGLSTVISTIVTFYSSTKGIPHLEEIRLYSANFIMIICGMAISIYYFYKGRTLYSRKYWRFAFAVNSPMLIHSLSRHALDAADRTMISNMVGKSAVGIYGVLYSVSALALIIWSAINASLIPYMFKNIKNGHYEKVSTIVERVLIIYSIVCIALTLIAPEILSILATDEYFDGIYMMPPIVAGIYFTSLYNIYSNILLYKKDTKAIAVSTLLAAIINIILNYVFIRNLGYQAASYTTLFSYIFLAVFQYQALRTDKIRYFNDKKIWIISILTCFLCLICMITYPNIYVRYTVILITIILGFVLKDRLILLLKEVKRG